MPKKVDRSHLISDEDFFTCWVTYRPLAYLIILTNRRQYPVVDTPAFGGNTDDYASHILMESRRLGIFSRYDPTRGDDEIKYLGNQFLNIIRHNWQDYCRTYRSRVDEVVEQGEGSHRTNYSMVDITTSHDPNIDWSFGCGDHTHTDSHTENSMAASAIINDIRQEADCEPATADSAVTVIKGLTSGAVATDEPLTVRVINAVLGLDEEARMGHSVRSVLRESAAAMLASSHRLRTHSPSRAAALAAICAEA